MIISFVARQVKRDKTKTSQYFPKPYENYKENVKVELDLSNYATKADLKEGASVHISKLVSKSGLASLKSKVDQTDINKLKPAHADSSKLSNASQIMMLLKKLCTNTIDTS